MKSSMITEKLWEPTDSRSFCIIFKENYCSFLILETGIFFMAAEGGIRTALQNRSAIRKARREAAAKEAGV